MNAILTGLVSGRDWGVYRAVRVKKLTTREVAAEFGISQTRVCQIVERVGTYVLEVAPEATEEQLAKACNVAQQIAADQVQYFIRLALESYDDSKGEQRTVRHSDKDQKTVTTTRTGHGEVRYLDLACRLALKGAELPVSMLAQGVNWEAGEEAGAMREEGSEMRAAGSEMREEQGAGELESPAKVACSEVRVEQLQEPLPNETEDAISAAVVAGCDAATAPAQAASSVATEPVQTTPATPQATEKLTFRQRVLRREFFAAAG